MAELPELITAAWQTAARELHIEFVTPWHAVTPDARRQSYLGLIPGFGRSGGTAIRVFQIGELSDAHPLDDNPMVAALSDQFGHYEPWLFKTTLRKWGWAGPPEKKPDWL